MGFEILPYSTSNGLMAAQSFFNIIIDPIILTVCAIIAAIILPIICIIVITTSRKKIDCEVAKLEIMTNAFLKIFMDMKSTYGHTCISVYYLKEMELKLLKLNTKKLLDPQEQPINALKRKIYKIIAHAQKHEA